MDKIVEGDRFYLHILNEELEYEVDQILIVEPKDTEHLLIVPGEDYCTLVTCTPYGVNTHRMLVRGHRIASEEKPKVHVAAEAIPVEPIIVAPLVAIPMLLLLLIWLHMPKPKKVRYRGGNNGPFI
jgi:sortase A